MPDAEVCDVVAVGLGPAGAAAANAAGALGRRALVVERDLAIFDRQRAIAFDDEALRVIRGLGLFDEVTAHVHLGITARFVGADGNPSSPPRLRRQPTPDTRWPTSSINRA